MAHRKIAALILLAACGTGPYGADAYWHRQQKPVEVYVDQRMRKECIDSVLDALDFWLDHGVDWLNYRPVRSDWYGFQGTYAPVGTITISERTLPDAKGTALNKELGRRIRSARLRLDKDSRCTVEVTAHELGHAMGLEHVLTGEQIFEETDRLMFPYVSGMRVTQDEIDWVNQ